MVRWTRSKSGKRRVTVICGANETEEVGNVSGDVISE